MAFTLDDLLDGLRDSRKHFLKHLDGLRNDQWDWKPYPECKSIRETLVHLVVDDRAALQSMESGAEPDYDTISETAQQEAQGDLTHLRALADASHTRLCESVRSRYAEAPLDTEASCFGFPMKLGSAVAHLASEDYYHAGQVAFIRMATDPTWDYYAAVYGAG